VFGLKGVQAVPPRRAPKVVVRNTVTLLDKE
jgi:hypothetical protein